MKKYFVIILMCAGLSLKAQTDKETFLYSLKDADTLRLDKYDSKLTDKNKPCVIFVFGGGFAAGSRNSEEYIHFFEKLADNGFVVISIDYRLGLKNITSKIDFNEGKIKIFDSFIKLFKNAIMIAVEDLFDATAFVLEKADEWGIDKNRIVTCGSSAGAVTVLQGEYELCNNGKLSSALPQDFRYAGIIAFAGAIYSEHGDLKWVRTPSPIQMFHGNNDSSVPYDKIKFRKLGLYGSKYISEKLMETNTSHYFYSVKNTAHEISVTPMSNNWNEIKTFLDKFVIEKQNLTIIAEDTPLDKPCNNKKIKLKDYIQTNFGTPTQK